MEVFAEIVNRPLVFVYFAKAPSQIFCKILSQPMKPVTTCGKRFILDV